ncbi:MAG: TonB-dependent receptor family protein [Alcanivoracaceae bacterium]
MKKIYPDLSSGPRRLMVAVAFAASSSSMLPSLALADTASGRLPEIRVVAEDEAAASSQPGAVARVSREDIELIQPMSTEEALRRVPGVHIKKEEESAVVANIGIRGLSAADYKTLILEDGVPVAPGLFVGNGRYYNPRIQRIEDIEVLKGAASLRYGPSTIGGVINYRTKQPAEGLAVQSSVGSHDTFETTVELGGSAPSGDGVFGAVVSTASSDGFMDKGYNMSDAMIKAGTAIGDNQWIGIKFSHHENDANISYRGLFVDDYRAGAKYNPAPDDWFLTGRKAFDINHVWDASASVRVSSLFYWSEMYRDYWRYGVNAVDSEAAGRWVYTNSLNGNNRAFERVGAETRVQILNDLFGIAGEAELGLRYMSEEMHDQTIAAVRATPRTGTISKDVVDSADSLALFVQNRFSLTEALSVTPGVRVEHYTQKRHDLRTGDQAKTTNTEVIPGVGATFQVAPSLQLFGSVHSAFSPALNGDALDGVQDQDLDAERSINVEIGLRGRDGGFGYELAAFRMQFDNQIIPANSGGFTRTNGGETLHQGVEGGVDYRFDNGLSLEANATWVFDAEFIGDRFASNGIDLTAEDGNRIPYTPELVANIGLGYQVGALKTLLSANYTGAQFTDTMNIRPITEVYNNNLWVGRVDSYTTADFSARYAVNQKLDLFGAVKNLSDERYVASLRQGIYVGPERSVNMGFRYQF